MRFTPVKPAASVVAASVKLRRASRGHRIGVWGTASCGDRHCPTCQGGRRAEWLDKQRETLLPADYYQVVFTVPHQLNGIAAAHPRRFYDLLFRAVRETLLELAASPKHLGGEVGGLMIGA